MAQNLAASMHHAGSAPVNTTSRLKGGGGQPQMVSKYQMRVLAWNYQGAGSPLVIPYLKEAGGLALMWKNELKIEKILFTHITIEAKILASNQNDAWWCVCLYASTDDQWGGRIRGNWSFKDFREFINTNEYVDLGYEGLPWTWSNSWDNARSIKERLDRAFGSVAWVNAYPSTKVVHLKNQASDHSMVLLDSNPKPKKARRRFHFDARWLQYFEVEGVVRNAWNRQIEGSKGFKVAKKVKECRNALTRWNKGINSNSKKEIKKLKEELEKIQIASGGNKSTMADELKKLLIDAYKKEEQFWHQKSRIKWLKEGGHNSAFFHTCVATRRKKNRISKIQKAQGGWCENDAEIGEEVAEYYRKLFTSSQPDDFEEILNGIPKTITTEMNLQLTKPVTEKEVKAALVFPCILTRHQDPMLNNKRGGKDAYMALKIDMSKAYYRVEWKFLFAVMCRMGFCPKWIKWIHGCLSSMSFSFNINGEKQGYVCPTRGIRQGDPLSPYLFLFCVEALSRLLKQATEDNRISRIKISRQSPTISHLFFADDSLMFCKANTAEAEEIMRILKCYERASGQQINIEKSSVFLSKNIAQTEAEAVLRPLGNIQLVTQSKYLGLPMVIGISKNSVLMFIKEKMCKKLQSWKGKMLSSTGKEVLLKSVALALLSYAMSVFKLSAGLCKELCEMMAKFWWGSDSREKKMHWKSWGNISDVKGKGGLGFRDVKNGASWIWQSLHSSIGMLESGLIKQVGDGNTIAIWKDRWLKNSSGKISTPKPHNCPYDEVSDLIHDHKWNMDIINSLFSAEEIKLITAIPISLFGGKDRYTWCSSANGEYTTKTGYVKAKESMERNNKRLLQHESTSMNKQNSRIWHQVWDLNTKHKIKHFLWKCLHDILPTHENIFRRTGKGEPWCRSCGESAETLEHLLFFCRTSEQIWKAFPIKWDGLEHLKGSFWSWWESLQQARERADGKAHIEMTANLLWHIWKARNNWNFNLINREGYRIS
ncbi:uncharacterized protein [Coffea arabica]|uniref:Reverse transcriptase domain-containing protein n=1 Tax=Coffea arabica TaxID=13443 RepID=A0ABM4U5R9_COFAR